LINTLQLIWTAIQLVLYIVFALVPLVGGIQMIYKSQTEFFTKDYHESMYLGLGIVILVVGIFVSWACLVRGIQLYRTYSSSKD